MKRLLLVLVALTWPIAAVAQTTVLPSGATRFPIVIPASAVNGAGTSAVNITAPSFTVSGGTAPTTGAIRLPNNVFMNSISGNGATTYQVIGIDSSNNLEISDPNAGTTLYKGGAHRFSIGGVSVWDINSSGNIVDDGTHFIQTGEVGVGSLPTCGSTAPAGSRASVNNANATFTAGIGAVVAAGGTNHVPVYCDGTNWRIG